MKISSFRSKSYTSSLTIEKKKFFLFNADIVSYLVENGADILKANYNGGTCLINSVQSVELCTFLLQNGANVNATDIQNKTALHYAIQEHRFETTKLLLDYNANPHLRSRYNDDALQTACLKGATQIFDYLGEIFLLNYYYFFFFLSRMALHLCVWVRLCTAERSARKLYREGMCSNGIFVVNEKKLLKF